MGSFEATLTSKGQVTVPVEVRTRLNLKEGDKLALRRGGDSA